MIGEVAFAVMVYTVGWAFWTTVGSVVAGVAWLVRRVWVWGSAS